ncbi:MAG: methyltransferase, FkbM family [Prosthecobacter sp.]|nr:methyltransferase, FkbM family [Prosthecobacter sp.]
MKLRQIIKYWLFGKCPGLAGSFRYCGVKVRFPVGSLSFKAACQQGIFEADNVTVLQALIRPGTCMFDVGANIGLMAIPVLGADASCQVVSLDPSINVLPSLRRTIAESPFGARWTLVEKAVGAAPGTINFTLSSAANSLFDGIRPTQRVESAAQVQVEMTTLDAEWVRLGKPDVSLIKIDVEGAESEVLRGATECLRAKQPFVLLEWNRQNLAAYECPADFILQFAAEAGYEVLSVPGLNPVKNKHQLKLHMAFTENFLLSPRS